MTSERFLDLYVAISVQIIIYVKPITLRVGHMDKWEKETRKREHYCNNLWTYLKQIFTYIINYILQNKIIIIKSCLVEIRMVLRLVFRNANFQYITSFFPILSIS